MAISDFDRKKRRVIVAINASVGDGRPLVTPAQLAKASLVPQGEIEEIVRSIGNVKFGVTKGYYF